jgi:hypothetical protein
MNSQFEWMGAHSNLPSWPNVIQFSQNVHQELPGANGNERFERLRREDQIAERTEG